LTLTNYDFRLKNIFFNINRL